MTAPFTGPSELLHTIKTIARDRTALVSELRESGCRFGLSELPEDQPVSDEALRGLITSLMQTTPVLYKSNKGLISAIERLPSDWSVLRQKKMPKNKIATSAIINQDKFAKYHSKYLEDKLFIIYCLSYIHNSSNDTKLSEIHAPMQNVLPIVDLLSHKNLLLGFLAAEQLVGMICYTYKLKMPNNLGVRIHIEYGLTASVMPDKLLAAKPPETLEAFKYAFWWMIEIGVNEKAFTQEHFLSYFKNDKDLSGSRAMGILFAENNRV